MAELKTDYKDAVFSGNRQYNMVANSNGTYSFIDVTDYEVAGDYFGAEDINETNTAINEMGEGAVTRLGTASVGSGTQPMYLNQGYPTESTSTVGGAAKPMYLSNGTMTACSSSVGSGTQPVYMSSGTITACGTTVGSGIKPIYSNSGVLTASSSTVGSSTGPVYLNSGTITACNAMVPLAGGVTMTGQLVAYNNTNYTTYQIHNIAFSTSVPSSLTNGTICFVYSS